ncbi:MAG: OadG family transporter subunit [Cyclobacteriaceae bacterium]
MTSELSTALNLLGIGMITVFVVLTLVVGVGKLLIRFVNSLPEEIKKPTVSPAKVVNGMDPRKVAAITAAVDHVTFGQGVITKIEKIDN